MPQPPSHDEHVASQSAVHEQTAVGRGSCIEVFLVFLRLGLTSFGGPVAHLGYFRTEFVDRRRWLDDYTYSDLVALCQFLPGPASSQVGMAIGLKRAGWTGMLAAWLAFTLPSAMALMLFALGLAHFGWLSGSAAIHGLKVAAVAVIAQAVWGMGRTLCPDRIRAGMACVAALITLALPSAPGQLAAIALGAVVGAAVLQLPPRPLLGQPSQSVRRGAGWVLLGLFAALLIGLPVLAEYAATPLAAQLAGFYRAGALVFGGGHVVLPMLESTAVAGGMVSQPDFLAGYGAAQAMPGPLFSFAAFLGVAAQHRRRLDGLDQRFQHAGDDLPAGRLAAGRRDAVLGRTAPAAGRAQHAGRRERRRGRRAAVGPVRPGMDVRHPWTGGLRAGPVAVRPAGVCALVAGMGGDDGGGGRLGVGWLA